MVRSLAVRIGSSIATERVTALEDRQRAAMWLSQHHAVMTRPLPTSGFIYLDLWLENIDAASEGSSMEDGEWRYLTVEPVTEAEGSLLTVGPVLRPLFNHDGSPWVRSRTTLEEPLGLPVHETADKLTYWRHWRSPALLAGWEHSLLLLRYYSCRVGKRPSLCGWAHVRLAGLQKQQQFHLQLRAPPEASRPRDLQRGQLLSMWVHGAISVAKGSNSSISRFFTEVSGENRTPAASRRPVRHGHTCIVVAGCVV